MSKKASRPTRGLPRLTIPLLIGLILALPLAACGEETDPKTHATSIDPKLVDRAFTDGGVPASATDTSTNNRSSIKTLGSIPMMRAPAATIIAAQDCTDCPQMHEKTLGQRAANMRSGKYKGSCDRELQLGDAWVKRLPVEFPVYPNGNVQEAAGVDAVACKMRVVSFTTTAPLQSVTDYYYTRARQSGYDAEHQFRAGEHILGGTRNTDGGAYLIILNTAGTQGTSVDIITNQGR